MGSPGSDDVLRQAAETALHAPSIFNTQPWRWELGDRTLTLWADRSRQLATTDPEGRMLTVSCGVALHHATLALAANGRRATIERLPDEANPDLLARITVTDSAASAEHDVRLRDAILARRTERRPFSDAPVPDGFIDQLRGSVEKHGVYLAELDADSLVRFQVTAARAGELDRDDPAYRAELTEWTHRPAGSGDGVPASTVVPDGPRTIPLRSFFPEGGEALLPGPGHDGGARYLVLWTRDDEPDNWLAAGEAMSIALLETTAAGLAASPMTDVVEVPASRALLHRLLDNLGQAQVALRVGVPATTDLAPEAPRRDPADTIR